MKHMYLVCTRFVPVFCLLLMLLSACTTIRLIAPYDKGVESEIAQIQKNTTTFFVKIERQKGSSKEDYHNHIEFYDNSKISVKSLLIRVGAIPQNTITEDQVLSLLNKFQKLEEQHKNLGLNVYALPTLESSFDQSFRAIFTLEAAKKEITDGKKGE